MPPFPKSEKPKIRMKALFPHVFVAERDDGRCMCIVRRMDTSLVVFNGFEHSDLAKLGRSVHHVGVPGDAPPGFDGRWLSDTIVFFPFYRLLVVTRDAVDQGDVSVLLEGVEFDHVCTPFSHRVVRDGLERVEAVAMLQRRRREAGWSVWAFVGVVCADIALVAFNLSSSSR